MKLPYDMTTFLQNGKNKELLFNLIRAESNGNNIMVRSPSGDIDILVLFILHQFGGKTVFIDNGVGKN